MKYKKKIGNDIHDAPNLLELNKQATMKQLVKKTFSLGRKISKHSFKKEKEAPDTLCFSLFYDALHRMKKGSQDAFFNEYFLLFIKEHGDLPTIPEIAPNEIHAWVRLCQHLDGHLDNKIQSKLKALLFLKDKLDSGHTEINNIKDLKKYLLAMNTLGFSGNKIMITATNEEAASNWSDEIKKHKFKPFFLIKPQKNPNANIKPYQLHSRIWRHILAVIEIITYYKIYKK